MFYIAGTCVLFWRTRECSYYRYYVFGYDQ